jgi:hypothetical protein
MFSIFPNEINDWNSATIIQNRNEGSMKTEQEILVTSNLDILLNRTNRRKHFRGKLTVFFSQ